MAKVGNSNMQPSEVQVAYTIQQIMAIFTFNICNISEGFIRNNVESIIRVSESQEQLRLRALLRRSNQSADPGI